MEEKLKYYEPLIDEFCIGFEYQALEDGRSPNDNKSWSTYVIDSPRDLEDYMNYYRNDHIDGSRVKLLDKEDIESLGFDDYKHGPSDWYKLEKRVPDGYASYGYWSCFRLVHNYNTHKIQIIAYEYGFNENDKHVLFQGSCRNKSELKKLLKQLNII